MERGINTTAIEVDVVNDFLTVSGNRVSGGSLGNQTEVRYGTQRFIVLESRAVTAIRSPTPLSRFKFRSYAPTFTVSSLRTSPPIAALEIHPYCAAGIWYAAPVADVQSGFPYSNVDVLQDYMGISDSLRLPTYLSLEAKVYRDFPLRISYRDRPTGKQHKIRIGLYSLDVTNRQNPHDVYSNVESPAVWPV